VGCKLRGVNFRGVSGPRRAFWQAFRVTEVSGDRNSNMMGPIVIGFGTRQIAGGYFGCTVEHLGAPVSSLGAP